ncbi:MAG: hypothetical protein RLZZ591_933 [Pseudomonadota bacterium]|jgi:hypothetical protein
MQAEAGFNEMTASTHSERRGDARYAPQTRAGVWFNIGIEMGELTELMDISLSGFAIRCDEWQLPVFLATEGRPLYCVLLLGEAHFGCMVSMAAPRPGHSGQIGFQFEAVPEDSIRLIHGLIDGMKSRLQEQAAIAEEI